MSNGDMTLVDCLDALASETRLAILRAVRTPRSVRDIRVPGEREDAGSTLSRQAVRRHLDRLIQAGFVIAREAPSGDADKVEFVVNHQRIFVVSDEVRNLARLRPAIEPEQPTTLRLDEAASEPSGPHLLLVRGLEEGSVFPLEPEPGRIEWVIGRRRGLAISLDYDPAVSGQNAVIRWMDGAHHVEVVPESRNGLRVNAHRLAPGERRMLRHGDLIGVGRSLLLYRT